MQFALDDAKTQQIRRQRMKQPMAAVLAKLATRDLLTRAIRLSAAAGPAPGIPASAAACAFATDERGSPMPRLS
jgi:hypothetical protein